MAGSSKGERTYSELTALIRATGSQVKHLGPQRVTAVKELEAMFDLRLPVDYRQFLVNFGALGGAIVIFGLATVEQRGMTAADAILLLRMEGPDYPFELLPIESLGGGTFACLMCDSQPEGKVVLASLTDYIAPDQLPVLANTFREYLYNRLLMLEPNTDAMQNEHTEKVAPLPKHKAHGLEVLERRVNEYNELFPYDHAKGGKLPRNHDWRPYRFCIQDVLFGTTVVRHNREHNCLEIDVFLTANIPEYDELAGAQALTCFLLSEAYKCGGTMELRFTREVEGGRIPSEFRMLAARYGVSIAEERPGHVSSDEARTFYAAITGFSPSLQERLTAMEQAGRLKMTRACYAVHHGVWSREQVELIVLGSQRPDSILAGLSLPHQRHLYNQDLLHARAAVLAGMLDRQLSRRERTSSTGTSYDLEDDNRQITSTFDGEQYAKAYTSDEEVRIPWLYPERAVTIQPGHQFNVLVRARDSADLLLHLASDIETGRQLRDHTGRPTFVVITRDVYELPDPLLQRILATCDETMIRLLVCPESVQSLDTDAAARLARSRLLRK